MFDPNQPMQMGGGQDFMVMQAEAERQRKLAEILRQQAVQQNADPLQGRIVGQGPGAQYVAPSIFQHLSRHIAPAIVAQLAEQRAKEAETKYNTEAGVQAEQWRRALPRSVPGRPELPGPQAEGGSPELAAMPEQPVTREQVLKYTLEGLRNPMLKTEAPLVSQVLNQSIGSREDKQFRDEQARLAAQERQAQLLERLKADGEIQRLRLEDKTLDRETRAELARQHNATLLQIAAMNAEARRAEAEARRAGQILNPNSREFRQDVEALSRRVRDTIPAVSAAQAVQDMLDEYTDPKTGKVKGIPGIGLIEGALPNWALSTKQSTNAQKFQTLLNAIVRDQAGLSQTLAESDRVTLELMAKGKARQEQFVAAWPSILNKLNVGIKAIEAGYDPSVVKTFNERGGGLATIGSKRKSAPAATPLTPEEQAELRALEAEEAARNGSR